MTATQNGTDRVLPSSQPWLHHHGAELQCWFLAEHLVDTPLVRI
jgi:hypothetical protein